MIFSRKRKDVFIAQSWFENRVSLYTAALISNKIAPILFEGGGGCCTQAKIAFFRFLILKYTSIFRSHGIFGFLPLYHTKVRWTLITVPDSIVGSHVYRKFSIMPPLSNIWDRLSLHFSYSQGTDTGTWPHSPSPAVWMCKWLYYWRSCSSCCLTERQECRSKGRKYSHMRNGFVYR